jgi:sulfate adenylyltransferase subunit 2
VKTTANAGCIFRIESFTDFLHIQNLQFQKPPMNARADHTLEKTVLSNAHLDALEEEAIFILREVAASFERPTLLFSGGKDSLVLLKCAEKAFVDTGRAPTLPEGAGLAKGGLSPRPRGGHIPYPLLMIDTGHNFHEVTDFRDYRAKQLGANLIVRSVEDSMARGTVRLAHPGESRNVHQSVTLLEAIDEFRFDALIGGARRDEEKARAKERIFSHRDAFGQWQPKAQRPELWTLFNTRIQPGEHFRVFPISNWTELDVWQYIDRENIELPSLYYAHQRQVVERKGLLVPVTDITPLKEGEVAVEKTVRFRTVGDITCTCPVDSPAKNAADVVLETLVADVSERGATRMDDKTSDASMEKRKKEGYF